MRTIEVYTRDMPIYNSDYIQATFEYYDLSNKEQTLFKNVFQALLEECKDIDFPVEFLDLFIDGKKFSPRLVKEDNFKLLLKDILNKNISFSVKQIGVNSSKELVCQTKKDTNCDRELLIRLRNLKNLAYQGDFPEFYFHQIPISKDDLFDRNKEKSRIKEEFLDFLPFLDMSDIFLSDVDIRNTNLANTNIRGINFSTIYDKSIAGTNLENVNLFGQNLALVDASRANLCGTYLAIETSSVKLTDTILDDSLLFLKDDKVINPVNHGYQLVKKPGKINLHL